MIELEAVERALLEHLQSAFPLVSHPFAALGRPLGLDEQETLQRVRRMKEAGLIRQIGAIFDTRRLGYRSTLVAFHVDGAALEAVAATINAHRGVSHNYARRHHFNLWFTLAVPPDQSLTAEIERLAALSGVDDWLHLPALRVFKIRAHFPIAGDGAQRAALSQEQPHPKDLGERLRHDLAPADIPLVRALQEDLPLIPRPFAAAAERLGLGEDELLDETRRLRAAGILRRFGAVLRHRRLGYKANGMACWVVPESRIEQVGRLAAGFPQVSHCYQRPAYPPRWPYTLFTMIHGQKRAEVEDLAGQIAREAAIADYQVLYSTREFKKERIRYFET